MESEIWVKSPHGKKYHYVEDMTNGELYFAGGPCDPVEESDVCGDDKLAVAEDDFSEVFLKCNFCRYEVGLLD